MIGNRLNWSCLNCKTNMIDIVGGVTLYKVNDENYFIKVFCNKCGKIHYVKEDSSKVVIEDNAIVVIEDNAIVEENGVCFF